NPVSRRSFLKRSSTAVAGGTLLSALPIERFAHAATSPGDSLRIALVGCGGRGSGAANQALSTSGDTKLVAIADAFKDRAEGALRNLKRQKPGKVDVNEDAIFTGFDGYKKAIEMADVVILATPPGFRPIHFEEAIRQGKHVFMEKPVAVDAPGVRQVLAAAEEAKKKNLKVGVGLQRRHQLPYLETVKRLHDGAIGDITSMRIYWNGTTPWVRTRKELEEKAGRKLTEMEYQMRNWYYFVWLSGDHIVEQHIHNMDVANWVKKGYPVRAHGMGGCEVRKGEDYGEIFDHHAVEFEYEDGSRVFSQCRHINGCWSNVSEHAVGTKGTCDVSGHVIRLHEYNPWLGSKAWRFQREGARDPYQQEHDDLFDAIRNDKPFNEGEYGAKSTFTAILGRMATYSGKILEWNSALNSAISVMPKVFAWDAEPRIKPDEHGMYPRAIPGKTEVV
ncbi:MAG: Gfo/Idh/MocA family oxidoreductase, partial [Verrucomicrobia subdivision 3 bacterium]|nr:Gfo/Idh/MocA family oxidoreductase [Limisphaerales bacterium]